MPRHVVARRAVFSHGDELPCLGRVADTSRGGLCIETDAPAKVGTELDIEVHPDSGEWVGGLRLRGRVVHATPGRSMGVRVLPDSGACQRPLRPSLPPKPRERLFLQPSSASKPRRWRTWLLAVSVAVLALTYLPQLEHRPRVTTEAPSPKPVPAAPVNAVAPDAPIGATTEPAAPPARKEGSAAALAASEGPADFRIEVDKSEKRLIVHRQGHPLRDFAVEFRHGLAPEGDFRLAVDAKGQEKARTGLRWVSLGSYSVGLRPSDAASLLRLCPAGTPVSVRP